VNNQISIGCYCYRVLEGRMNDDATLRDNKVTKGSKIMVVGSTINDVLAVTEPAVKTQKQNDKLDLVSSKEPFCKQKVCCCRCFSLLLYAFTSQSTSASTAWADSYSCLAVSAIAGK